MTRDRGLGPLGRRLLAAFVAVALASVAVLAVIAIAGTVRGITTGEQTTRDEAAVRVAAATASAYAAAGGWSGADLAAADELAGGAGARLVVRDASGQVVQGPSGGMGPGMGMGMGQGMGLGASTGAVSAPVVVDGQQVGTVVLGFGSSSTGTAQQVAWTWILLAAGIALLVAFAAAWWVTRRFTRPLVRLASVADEVASGSLSARPSAQDLAEPGEIGELARAFATAAERVETSDTARKRMSADLAHELRTPLTVLQAGLEELRDGLEAPDPDRIDALHRQALRLGRVVDDLAELSAAETAGLSLRHDVLDLAALAGEAVREAAPAASAAGLELTARDEGPVRVVGDADRLHQVVGNLLSNAVRYCRAGDRVSVTTGRSAGRAVLEVADTGPGIPADDLPHVFDRLWRGSADSDPRGSGIGLAVVRELVVAHGGTVSARSDGRTGTVVRVELPAAR